RSSQRCRSRSTSAIPTRIITCRCSSVRSGTVRIEGPEQSASMPELSWNRYGKSRIRLVKVRRPSANTPGAGDAPHELVDLTLDVQLEGDFETVYVDGDNTPCIATDTMKNTVYAMARQNRIDHVEAFASKLADHFLAKPAVSRVRI